MRLIDFILNIAGVLLCLNWRTTRFDPFFRTVPATLGGTVRRAEPRRLRRWHFLPVLGTFLAARALVYWRIGPAVEWTPGIDLGLVTLVFRGDALVPVLLFSALSFLHILAVAYFWLLAIVMINRRVVEPDPLQRIAVLQLGPVARWPRTVQVLLPIAAVSLAWIAVHPLLVRVGTANPPSSMLASLQHGVMLGVWLYATLKFLLPAFLFLHLVASYVYLGSSPLWDFIGITAGNILAPLNRVRMRIGRVDFAPLVGIILILLLLHALPDWIVNTLAAHHPTLLPQ